MKCLMSQTLCLDIYLNPQVITSLLFRKSSWAEFLPAADLQLFSWKAQRYCTGSCVDKRSQYCHNSAWHILNVQRMLSLFLHTLLGYMQLEVLSCLTRTTSHILTKEGQTQRNPTQREHSFKTAASLVMDIKHTDPSGSSDPTSTSSLQHSTPHSLIFSN